ncbi:O-linked N-acetylglucosamine transferase [Dunaliella salina]|uniref:protein O-GlcNAc transferase n=1 Tax=Dunaliella salina TaxID=3046 RepID=A0ABQ7G1H2_DUNSA|nr:O-linked N-acetylglucosamine transferase [Dunaliella salina]|eukprot:KAF5828446.1 O-linked N-acetylglucosamine transferase [Dunaliella salina]
MNHVFPKGLKAEEECSEQQAQELKTCLCLAKTLLNSKRAADALVLIDRMVARFPAHIELLHLRGQALQAANNGPAAFATFMSVLSINCDHVPSICSVGEIYKAKGMLQESAAAYSKAREVAPDDAVARHALAAVLTDLGTRAKSTGAVQEGMALYQQAMKHCPEYAPAFYNMGVLNSEAKQFDAALEWYHKATLLHPLYAEAHCNVGVILKERGDLEGAISAYNRALSAAPNFGIVHGNLAIALTELGTRIKVEGRIAEGISLYERALAHNPKYADALYNLGVAHGTLGQHEKAIFMYETAIQHNPKCAEAYNNLGVIYKERDNLDKAMECYSAALSVKPDFPQSLNNMGVIFTAQGRAQEALTLLTAAIVASPSYAEAHNNLGVLQRDVGAIPEALASYSRCLELVPDSRNAGQNRLLALNYIHSGSEPMVCQEHAEWGRRCQRLFTPLPPFSPSEQDSDPDRPLRVGYISPDLFTHSVSYFAEAPLSHHRTPAKHGAAGHVHHFAYCCTPKQDAKTARIQAAVEAAGGTWREASTMSESDLAKLIREDKIDILVELTGHTANNRLGTMALQPAPIQATWIGYPNSTGLEAIDYRFTDDKCDPLDTQQTHVEELVRLPGCFLCYTPAAPDQPPVLPLPALTNGYVTFGSFNNLAKITPEVLKLWARILLAVPNSRLMLKSKPFACETARNHFLGLLQAEGVESWRVDLVPLVAGNTEHLATYSSIDISLDPFPYAGTTTTCESLFMGVPCITLAGDSHAYNVGVSLLAAVGLEKEWVAHDQDEYVALAVKHTSQLVRLGVLRSCLRPRMLSSPLCDAPAFMARLEGVYRQLWHRYGPTPSHFPFLVRTQRND